MMLYGFGQMPWALNCIAQGSIPDAQLGCIPAALYPAVRGCVDKGGTWDPYLQICIPPVGPVTPAKGGLAETVARAACAAMRGRWNDASKECVMPDRKYGLTELHQTSQRLQSGGEKCPEDRPVLTPKGCFPYPGGVVDDDKDKKAKAGMPDWVLPVAVAGIAVLALAGTRRRR